MWNNLDKTQPKRPANMKRILFGYDSFSLPEPSASTLNHQPGLEYVICGKATRLKSLLILFWLSKMRPEPLKQKMKTTTWIPYHPLIGIFSFFFFFFLRFCHVKKPNLKRFFICTYRWQRCLLQVLISQAFPSDFTDIFICTCLAVTNRERKYIKALRMWQIICQHIYILIIKKRKAKRAAQTHIKASVSVANWQHQER